MVMAIPDHVETVSDTDELREIAETRDKASLALDHKYRVYDDENYIDVYGGSKPLGPRVIVALYEEHRVVPEQILNHTHLRTRVQFEGVDYENGYGKKKFGYRMWFCRTDSVDHTDSGNSN
jgi:hypothetical protein